MNSVLELYFNCIRQRIQFGTENYLFIDNVKASYSAFFIPALLNNNNIIHILPDEEQALISFNEISSLLNNKQVFFFPALYQADGSKHKYYDFNLQQRVEVLENIISNSQQLIVVTYYDAITEPVSDKENFKKHQFVIHQNENISYNFLLEFLREYHFVSSDFVYFPGQYAVRGNIIDVFSYSNEYPIRIELKNNQVERLSEFHPNTQMSFRNIEKTSIIPKIDSEISLTSCVLDYFSNNDIIVW